MSVIARFEVIPVRDGSMSTAIASALQALDNQPISYQTTATDTIIEADTVEQVFAAVQAAHQAIPEDRVITSVEIDEDRRRPQNIGERIASVERELGHPARRQQPSPQPAGGQQFGRQPPQQQPAGQPIGQQQVQQPPMLQEPVQRQPVQQPLQQQSVQQQPVQQQPVQQQPVQQQPVQQPPVQQSPVQQPPVQQSPVQQPGTGPRGPEQRYQ